MTKELENALHLIAAIKGNVAFLTDETVKGVEAAIKAAENKKLKITHYKDDGGGVYMLELVEDKIDCLSVIAMFKKICTDLPAPRLLSEGRKAAIRKCKNTLDKQGITFEMFFEKIHASDFLCRMGSGRSWKADFDFVMKPAQISKIIEGCYDNRSGSEYKGSGKISRKPTYDIDRIKRDAALNTEIKY